MFLRDHRGKVVVLAFWGYWCALCQDMLPHERALVSRMRGRPFVLLGVNSDHPSIARELQSGGEVTWRSWSDGGEVRGGDIAKRWNVQALPAFFTIDAKGFIQHRINPLSDDHDSLHIVNSRN